MTSESPTTTSSLAAQAESATKTVTVVCPEAWGALPVVGEFTAHTIERLTVHHTAVLLHDNADAPARARQHQRFHQERGWLDLAYHFLIDADGNVYAGRPVAAVGDTGTEYDPTGHFLVCCEGDFTQQEIPDAQVAALADMLAWAVEEFDVSIDTISGHRDWAQTSCPGDSLYDELESGFVAGEVQRRIDAGGVGLEVACGADGARLIEAIELGSA